MAEQFKNTEENLAERLNNKLTAARKPLFACLIAVVVVLVALVAFVLVVDSSTKKGLTALDEIYFSLTSKAEKEADSIDALENEALQALSAYAAKGGIVGVRANLLVAELNFSQNKFEEARDAWLKASAAKKGAYTAPLAYFNAAVCSENLGDNESAARYYKLASEAKDFLLVDHALFSLGRVNEALSDVAAAKDAYEKLNDTHPDSTWAHLAKSRLLSLQAAGSIE